MEWRLILDGAGRGAWNMAVDEALAEAVDRGDSSAVVRLYRWNPPCLSLGASQPPHAADHKFCSSRGIDVVRRPTGGRAVLHQRELTYLVAAPLGRDPFSHDLQAAYRRICEALVVGLRRLGVPAELSGAPADGMIRPTEPVPCFVGPASGEVTADGRKLVGSAMRRVGGAILQHGALLEGWDSELQAGCLGLPDDASLRPAVVTLQDLLGVAPDHARLAASLVGGFESSLGIHLVDSALTERERDRAELLERERYDHARWTVHRDRALAAE